jgi:hypothetical protein
LRSDKILIGLNVYNNAKKLKNNRYHQEYENHWKEQLKKFNFQSDQDTYIADELSMKKPGHENIFSKIEDD